MCEFKVLIDGKEFFQDVIYAKLEGNNLILRDVIGTIRNIPNVRIVEVDVSSEKLVLQKS